jgi:transketolase
LNTQKPFKESPPVILAKTIKGKGVSYMENVAGWHGKAPNAEEYEVAMRELKQTLAGLEAE